MTHADLHAHLPLRADDAAVQHIAAGDIISLGSEDLEMCIRDSAEGVLICTLSALSSFGPVVALANLGASLTQVFASADQMCIRDRALADHIDEHIKDCEKEMDDDAESIITKIGRANV